MTDPVIQGPNTKSLWLVVWTSFLWSVSSLMVFSLFPSFLKDELNMSGTIIGLMEGIAIFLSFIVRLFSGIWSDHLLSRKPFITLGAILSTLIKPAFAFVGSFWAASFMRVTDRAIKGIRAAPLDALVSDLSLPESRATAFGLRQTFKTLGVITGGAIATLCMILSHNNYRLTFLLATLPAAFSIGLALRIKQPSLKEKGKKPRAWHISEIKNLPREYWSTLCFCFLLFGAYFSEIFVGLSLRETGLNPSWLPPFIVSMNGIQALTALPFGKLSDRYGRQEMLVVGVILLIIVNGIFVFSSDIRLLFLGIILIGAHMGLTKGLLRAILSENVPAHLRGTAYAVFYSFTSFSLFASNFLAGIMSDLCGPSGPVISGGVFALLALLFLTVRMAIKPSKLFKDRID